MPGLVLSAGGLSIGLTGDAPNAPVSLDGDPTGETTATITWTDDAVLPANSTSFLIEISDDAGETWATAGTVAASPFNDTGLSAGTTYKYRVKARNAWGTSAASAELEIATPSPGPPAAPSNLQLTVLSSESINATVQDNSDNDEGFKFQRALDSGFTSDVQTFETEPHSPIYTFSGLTAETPYYIRALSFNGAGESAWTATESATTDAAGDPVFGVTPHDTGITADIADWFSDETTRLGHTPGSGEWWLWGLLPGDVDDSGDVDVIVVHHSDVAGARIYEHDGAFGFTDVTASFGVNYYDLTMAGGMTLLWDFNGDGLPDYCGFGSTYGVTEWFRNDAGTTLVNVGDGPQFVAAGIDWYYVAAIGNLSGNDRCDFRIINTPIQSSLTANRYTYTAGTTGDTPATRFTRTADTLAPPAGIPQAVLDDLAQYTYPTVTSNFMEIRFIPFDLTGSGSANDLIVQIYGSYDGPSAGRYLISDGAGGYIDKTADWGLPEDCVPIMARQWAMPLRDEAQADAHLHLTGAGSGRPSLFLWKRPLANSDAGYWTWNGTGYTRQASDPLTTKLAALTTEVYQVEIFAVDFTNAGHLDYYLTFPRGGQGYLFLNDGSGGFSLYAGTGTGAGGVIQGWDGYGHCLYDIDNDGLIDLIVGGNASGGGNGGVSGTTAKVCSILENTTTAAGHWLKVKPRRTTGHNRFAVGGHVEIFVPNTSTLLRRWKCRPDGLPVHFGCGSRATVDVKVTWPDGTTKTIEDQATDQSITVNP